jgi:hypothetical protein
MWGMLPSRAACLEARQLTLASRLKLGAGGASPTHHDSHANVSWTPRR